jgi:hypothetical protein
LLREAAGGHSSEFKAPGAKLKTPRGHCDAPPRMAAPKHLAESPRRTGAAFTPL